MMKRIIATMTSMLIAVATLANGPELVTGNTAVTQWKAKNMANASKLETIKKGYGDATVYKVTKTKKGGVVLKVDDVLLEKGKTYLFSFMARADAPKRAGVMAGLKTSPYNMLSSKKEMIDLKAEWTRYEIELTIAKAVEKPAAMAFSLYQDGIFEFSGFSVKEDTAVAGPKHLFILSGQSNMQGHRPDEGFTPTVAAAFGRKSVIVIQDALGGQPIHRWDEQWVDPAGKKPKESGDLYARLMGKVKAEIAGKEIKSVSFFWMQGERDAKMKWGPLYEAALKRLIKQIADDLDRDDLNVVIGRLSDFDMKNEKYPHWTMVRDIQVKVAKEHPRGTWIDTDDLNTGTSRRGKAYKDDLHYSVEGYKTFGKRMAEAAIKMITAKKK